MDEAEADRKKITVFLLDDHEIVRRGVRDLLEAEPRHHGGRRGGHRGVGPGPDPGPRPDVAVLDVRLPDGDGVTVCREIRSRCPEVACLMLTSFADDEALFDAIMAGRVRLRAQADPRHRPGRRGAHGRRRAVAARPGGGQPGHGAAARPGAALRPAGRADRAGAARSWS